MLRLLLALSVVMSHGLTTLSGVRLFDGAGAVWTFFAISGFLITLALGVKYRTGPRHLAHFYWNRAIRLIPAYWVWLAATLLAYAVLPTSAIVYQAARIDGTTNALRFWAEHAPSSTFEALLVAGIANLTGLFSDALLYSGLDRVSGDLIANARQDAPIWAMGFMTIGQYWSIGVELCFYAMAPWVVRRPAAILILFLVSISGSLELAWTRASEWLNLSPAITFLQFPRFIWLFMVGAALAHLYARLLHGERRHWEIASLVVMVSCIAWRGSAIFPISTFPWWLFVVIAAALPCLFHLTSSNRFDRFAGDLSYPVYVNHFILIQLLGTAFEPAGWLFASASICGATLTVLLVERPMKRFKWNVTALSTSSDPPPHTGSLPGSTCK